MVWGSGNGPSPFQHFIYYRDILSPFCAHRQRDASLFLLVYISLVCGITVVTLSRLIEVRSDVPFLFPPPMNSAH